MEWSEGDLVWFDPGLGHPLPGEIQEVHRAAQVIIVQALINGKPQTFNLQAGEGTLRSRQDLGSSGVEDMTQLEDLHEASLLWNLRLRYDRGLIYTFAGSILIAVNPYKMFPDAYGLEIAKQYAGKPLGILPPHLFAIGAAAHAALPSPQVVVISGESGAGKTESTKLVMQYLAAVVPGGGSASAVITEQILEAAPLLEAFGNARTARNDNSSRFGKYLEVYFKQGAIVGAKITQYLLEKSRIVTQAPGERNYHVFYELLGGLSEPERTKYGLLEADKYFYLNQGGSDCTPGGRVDWSSLQGAMQVLGVSDAEQDGIVRVLASVLHLGNVYFHRRQLRHGQEGVEVGSDAEIKWAAHLLHISAEGLHLSLTTRITEARGERVHTPLGIDQALDARDAFAKILYSGLFSWLVSRINSIVHKGGTHDAHRISILDIFGFEDLAENSFEQLCINFANENLQLYFNKHVFKLEQAEYARERLEWTALTWEDNLPVIHLLAKKPVGIFHLLDDESNFPRASDLSFLEKCHYNHALSELYSRPRVGAQEFGVTHYAGQVWYCVEGFLEKNRDALRQDVLELLASSKLSLIGDMTRQMRAQRDIGKTMPKGTNGRFVTMKPRTPTVAARFSDSLQQLLQSMAKCNPWFVRCIKPNNDKHALRMDMPCVLQQLRYLGMLDTIRIRQRGYPVRLRFQHFVERYRHMIKSPLPRGTPYRELCRSVLDALPGTGIDGPDFQLGATRVFLREGSHRTLESGRSERLRNAAVIIQKNVRRMLARKQLHSKKRAAVKIQSIWRGYKDKKRYRNLKAGTVKAQALFRGHRQRKQYAKLKVEMKRKRAAEKAQKERQQQKLAKEQERAAPIVHLDIPAELAFMFSKMDGWNPVHGDRHLVKVVGTVPGPPVGNEMPTDLDQFSFGKFSSVYCNGIKLQSRRDPITTPFLIRAASRDQDFHDSLAVFKLILRWTGDSNLDNAKDKALADYIAHKGLASRGLRDEILVQLCNQAYRTDEVHSLKLWQLMSHCLSCFQPGLAFQKYLMKFTSDNAPAAMKEIILKKLLRNSGSGNPQITPYRTFPPSWLEWRAASRLSDIAIGLTLPDDVQQTVAIDSWTTCEEAAALAISSLNVPNQGWTVVLDDSGLLTDSCGLDFVLDLIAEKELCPAFPAVKNDLLRCGRKNSRMSVSVEPEQPSSPKRPQVPPPEPPQAKQREREHHNVVHEHRLSEREQRLIEREHRLVEREQRQFERELPIPEPIVEKKMERDYNVRQFEGVARKTSHDMLSRSSALNERYFETDKSRSKSLDDLLANESGNDIISHIPEPEPLVNLGLSESRLNDRYHSTERLTPVISKEPAPRYQKSQYAGKRSAGSHSSKYMDRSDYATRSSAMSDTSEAPSLASHVRRVRVPSQASDVDQFLDDLFSPVLDGSLDELSDARSLAASIRGGIYDFLEAPTNVDEDLNNLANGYNLVGSIKGGGHEHGVRKVDGESTSEDQEVESITNPLEVSLDEYITDLFQPIFVNDSLKRLTEKTELAEAIKGGGTTTTHQSSTTTTNGFITSPISPRGPLSPTNLLMMGTVPSENYSRMNMPTANDPAQYQQHVQLAFLQSAMVQNLQIQQQLLAQNQALQTLLSQQETGTTPPLTSPVQMQTTQITSTRKQSVKSRIPASSPYGEIDRNRKPSADSNGSHIPPPPPPPMPPPIEFKDPSEARPFLDPYGRAKTVRIGKWRWPPPKGSNLAESDENFMHFKMRQNQRKNTPQSQGSAGSSPDGSSAAVEWEEFEIEPATAAQMKLTMDHHNQSQQTNLNLRKFSQPEPPTQQSSASNSNMQQVKLSRRSFEIGAERPPPGSVGKLKLSSEMRQRLEQVTAGHSVRSSTSTKSDQRAPAKLEETRKMMLQQQLSGHHLGGGGPTVDSMDGTDIPSVRTHVQRMEAIKRPPPPPWPAMLPPAPSGPAPPPPVRPPSSTPPMPPPPVPFSAVQQSSTPQQPLYQQQHQQQQQQQHHQQQQQQQQQQLQLQQHHKHHANLVTKSHHDQHQELPAFVQRQERDTFGAHQHWNGSEISKDTYDSWGRAEAAKLDMVYETTYKKEIPAERERSRSRSRSRDRENFSESVWDRSEVEGPPSSGSDRDRYKEQRDRIYEMRQVERERESKKVYQPVPIASNNTSNNNVNHMSAANSKQQIQQHIQQQQIQQQQLLQQQHMYEKERITKTTKSQSINNTTTHSVPERATFKTHMAQRMERERKTSSSTFVTQNSEKIIDDLDQDQDWTTPTIPPTVPAPIPPSLKSPAAACLTYNRVPWKLRVRKEVFRPAEPIGPPIALDLLFAQVASDVFGGTTCLRISPQEKRAALNLLTGHGVTLENMKGPVRSIVKRHLVDMARGWPLYFARLFIVNGSPQLPEVCILAVSHNGVYLARRDQEYVTVIKSVPFNELQAAITLPRPAALQIHLKNGNRMILHATRAMAIQQMIQSYCQEFKQIQSKTSTISSGARAAAQTLNVPIEKLEAQVHHNNNTLLHNNTNKIITTASIEKVNHHHHNNNNDDDDDDENHNYNHHHQQQQQQQQQFHHHQQQQQQQIIEHNGKSTSPNSYQQNHHKKSISNTNNTNNINNINHEDIIIHHQQQSQQSQQLHQQQQHLQHHNQQRGGNSAGIIGDDHHDEDEDDIEMNISTSPSVMKYSLLQFAMQHFRNDQMSDEQQQQQQRDNRHHQQEQLIMHHNLQKNNNNNMGRTNEKRSSVTKPHADLVKWQGIPIRTPLLRLPTDLSALALECFECILRYCGDLPPDPELTEVKCVYTVLMHCHKHLSLRDEVYCQLMKQTTANRSPCPDSSQRAWRLLSILAAYFGCSDALKPYLLEHLTSAASDRRRSCHGTAAVCLTNLRKTARCGGRKNVPSVEEVTAVSAGRSARRQIYRLPGGPERVVNTRCSTVVADVIAELCALLGIDSQIEQQEFSLYCIVQGDAFTMPLAADEYILDVTTELLKSGQPFYLIFCRSVWHFPLKRGDPAPTPLYIEVLFNQVAPDYLEGLLLELPNGGPPNPDVVRDMARIAALLHRAADLNHVPAMKEIKFLLPKPALGIRELRPAQWVSLVQSAWPSIASLGPAQVKGQFLNVLSMWPLFGSSFFAVKRVWAEETNGPAEEANPIWRELILALNRRGILFLDPNTHETLQSWPFTDVISTRKVRSEDGALFLDMKVGNLMQQRVIRVQTEQAHEISRLVRQYITMAQVSGQRDRRD